MRAYRSCSKKPPAVVLVSSHLRNLPQNVCNMTILPLSVRGQQEDLSPKSSIHQAGYLHKQVVPLYFYQIASAEQASNVIVTSCVSTPIGLLFLAFLHLLPISFFIIAKYQQWHLYTLLMDEVFRAGRSAPPPPAFCSSNTDNNNNGSTNSILIVMIRIV